MSNGAKICTLVPVWLHGLGPYPLFIPRWYLLSTYYIPARCWVLGIQPWTWQCQLLVAYRLLGEAVSNNWTISNCSEVQLWAVPWEIITVMALLDWSIRRVLSEKILFDLRHKEWTRTASWKLWHSKWVGSWACSKNGTEGQHGRKTACAMFEVGRKRAGDASACKAYVGWDKRLDLILKARGNHEGLIKQGNAAIW